MDARTTAKLDEIVARLQRAAWKEREQIKDELLAIAEGSPERDAVRDHLEEARKGLSLELRWEIDEVLEAIAPPPEPEKPKEPEKPEDPNKPLSASDLNLVYDDPRGFMLYKTKKGERWFATQVDQRTGQPQTFELHAQEIKQLKTQLTGSPYWVLGAGEAPTQ
jgi:hypothetical protein